MLYTMKPIEAQQFVAETLPWPTGVEASTDSLTGYVFRLSSGLAVPIADGDYTVSDSVIGKAEFESKYQP